MHRKTLSVFLLVGMLALSACMKPGAVHDPGPTPAAQNGEWFIAFTQSGGIMGMSRSMTVSSNRAFTIKDNRSNLNIEGQLTLDETGKMQHFLDGFDYAPPQDQPGMVCADCFVFDLQIQTSVREEAFHAVYNDLNINESSAAELIDMLRAIMDRELNQ